MEYGKQALFVLAAYGAYIAIDQTFLEPLVTSLTAGLFSPELARWLLFPFLLLLLCILGSSKQPRVQSRFTMQ